MKSTVNLHVLLFAAVREAAESDGIQIEVGVPVSAADLLDRVAEQLPEVSELIRVSRLAVNGQYVASDHLIDSAADEVALIPPVSGG